MAGRILGNEAGETATAETGQEIIGDVDITCAVREALPAGARAQLGGMRGR